MRTLIIYGGIGAVVLPTAHEEHHDHQPCCHEEIKPQRMWGIHWHVIEILHQEEKQISGWQHQHKVEQCRKDDALLQVFCPFFRKSETVLKIFNHDFMTL
ncbi:MAG: hypothetical protein E7G86_10135 [Prevotella bivia]|nr:hypothetical protein [Prevotella bivia]